MPSVHASNKTASFFRPSKYQSAGRPKTNDPVTAAENTNKESMIIGARMVLPSPNICGAKKKKEEIRMM